MSSVSITKKKISFKKSVWCYDTIKTIFNPLNIGIHGVTNQWLSFLLSALLHALQFLLRPITRCLRQMYLCRGGFHPHYLVFKELKEVKKCMPYNMALRTKGTLLTRRARFPLTSSMLSCITLCSAVVAIHLIGNEHPGGARNGAEWDWTKDKMTLSYF